MAGRRIAITIKVEGATKAVSDLTQVTNKTKEFSATQKSLASNFTTAIIGARLISAAYTNIKRAIDFGVKSAISFEFSMKKIQAITGTTGEELGSLEKVVRDLAAVSPRTATEVADTALAMAKLGLSSREVEDALEGVIGLSVALDENVEAVGSTLVAVKNVFQKEAKDLTQISDQLFTGFANSALNLDKFSTAFSFAGGAAKLAGVEFEELTALMGVLTDAGIRGSTIGTQLRSIFLDMSDSSSKFGKATGGVTIKQDGLINALKAAKGVIHSAADAKKLFGKRAVSVIDVLTRSISKFEALNKTISESDGATKKAADTLSDSMEVALKQVSSAWVELNIEMSKIYSPALIGGLNLVRAALTDIKGIVQNIRSGAANQFGIAGIGTGQGFGVTAGKPKFELAIPTDGPLPERPDISPEEALDKAIAGATKKAKVDSDLLALKQKQEEEFYSNLAKMASEARADEEKALKDQAAKQEKLNELRLESNELWEEYNLKLMESTFQFQAMATAIDSFGSALNTVAGGAIDALFQDTVNWGSLFKNILKDIIKQLVQTAIKVFVIDTLMKSLTGGGGIASFLELPSFGPKLGPGFASGYDGIVSRPTPMIVGEAGPERVQITPAAKTARGKDKDGTTIIVQGSIIDKDGFMRAVNQANQGIGRNFVRI